MISRKNSHYKQQKSPIERFLFVLGIVFLLLYFILGIMIIFYDNIPLNITHKGRLMMGTLLIVYSVFRFTRLILNNRKND